MFLRRLLCGLMVAVAGPFPLAVANPLISPGDMALRQDIQLLADRGVVRGPVTSWPLSWAAILADIRQSGVEDQASGQVMLALARVRERARREAQAGELHFDASASAAEQPLRIRSFADTPREAGEIGGGISWTGNRFTANLSAQVVASPADGEELRADGSLLGLALGNYSVSASTMDRWWGPGWDGSLILSNNARPVPALAIDRSTTEAFESRWLSWMGPWDLSIVFGELESERAVPHARLFGIRFNFRPLPSLEVGLSRTAQWCGDNRPCDFDSFSDLLLGKDNRGDDGIDSDNEPGNQLAGVDFRWSGSRLRLPIAVYGQLIGEDEAGGFPSRHIGQLGMEFSGSRRASWSYRLFAEYAATTCGFYKSSEIWNCAYNHSIYRSGYRYRGRTLGHGADNDANLVSAGLSVVAADGASWLGILRIGELNRGGAADQGNPLAATPERIMELQISHRRRFRFGQIEAGAGIERIDYSSEDESGTDAKAWLQWRASY